MPESESELESLPKELELESHGIDSLLESIPIVESIPPLESIPSLESIPLLESIPNWNQLNCGMELELESLNSKKCPKSDSGIDSTAGIITPLAAVQTKNEERNNLKDIP